MILILKILIRDLYGEFEKIRTQKRYIALRMLFVVFVGEFLYFISRDKFSWMNVFVYTFWFWVYTVAVLAFSGGVPDDES